jgi:pseudaminic acid cytidylyltransferase
MSQVIAIIPARAGSKRLPHKHILLLNGKPLIAWTIEAAIESGVFDEVIVNTDCQDIATIAREYGATVPFVRPSHLAEDHTPTIDVIKHTLEWYQEKQDFFKEVMLLQPTSPLRDGADIKEAWDLYLKSQVDSVVSVCELEHPVQWTYNLNEELGLTALFEDNLKRSQEYEKNYRLNGAIYITKSKSIIENNKLFSTSSNVGYVMPKFKSVDIDVKEDFDIAEIFQSRKLSSCYE